MKKLLITGILGYVGREICEVLKNNPNYEIYGFDNRFLPSTVKWLSENRIKYYERDIFDAQDLIEMADAIIHLSGETQVPVVPSQSTPEGDAKIHKYGTEATRFLISRCPKHAKIIFASSQVVYDSLMQEVLNIDESFEPGTPLVAYSQSKRLSEIDLFGSDKNFIVARFASVFGYNNNIRYRILPNLLSKMAAQNQNLKIFGGENFKPLISCNDLARFIQLLLESDYNREIFHCVSEHVRVIDIARMCQKANPLIQITETNDAVPNKGFTLSNKKLLSTGFKFEQNLEDEIKKMISIWSLKL